MKKSSLILIPALFSLFLLGCVPLYWNGLDHKYDNSPIYVDRNRKELERIVSNLVRIQTSLRFKLEESTPTITAIGQGIVLDGRHILTARHVVTIEAFRRATPFGVMEFPISEEDKLEEEIFLISDDGSRIKTTMVYSDKDKDIALLRAEREIHYFPFRIGNSDDFRLGDSIFLLGNFQTGVNIRAGNITQLQFVRYGVQGEVTSIDENIFGISAVTVEGDSGSPIFLIRDGRFELGGIVTFLVLQGGLGFGTKINPIMHQIKGYVQ